MKKYLEDCDARDLARLSARARGQEPGEPEEPEEPEEKGRPQRLGRIGFDLLKKEHYRPDLGASTLVFTYNGVDIDLTPPWPRKTLRQAILDAANDLIGDLTLSYNKARQEAITKELLDIVGGASALTAA